MCSANSPSRCVRRQVLHSRTRSKSGDKYQLVMWTWERRGSQVGGDRRQRLRAVDQDLDRVPGPRRADRRWPTAGSGCVERAFPAESPKPPTVVSTDLLGDRRSQQHSADRVPREGRVMLRFAVAGVAQRVERERDQPGGDEAEEVRAVRMVRQGRERTVQAHGFVRVVIHGGQDQEDADQSEDDHAGQVTEGGDPGDPRPNTGAHLLGLGVAQEVVADSAVPLVQPDAAQDGSRNADEPGASRPAEHAGRRMLRVTRSARRRSRAGSRSRSRR